MGSQGPRRGEGIFPAEGNPGVECQPEEVMRGTRMRLGVLCYRESGWGGHPYRMIELKDAEEGVPRGMAWQGYRSVGREVGQSRMGSHLSRRAPLHRVGVSDHFQGLAR